MQSLFVYAAASSRSACEFKGNARGPIFADFCSGHTHGLGMAGFNLKRSSKYFLLLFFLLLYFHYLKEYTYIATFWCSLMNSLDCMCSVTSVCVATGFWKVYSALVLTIIRGKFHVTVFSYLPYDHSRVRKILVCAPHCAC